MTAYYCIVNTPGVPVREIAAIRAANDAAACIEIEHLAARWPGFETIVLYDGERPVTVKANPLLGFAVDPLQIGLEAA